MRHVRRRNRRDARELKAFTEEDDRDSHADRVVKLIDAVRRAEERAGTAEPWTDARSRYGGLNP